MHTLENQCVSKAIAIKISTLAFALLLCLLAFYCFCTKKHFAHFLFLCVLLNVQIENPA